MALMINETILALIPARAGSKGINKKNMINVNGLPLIDWTIAAATKSKNIEKIIISSNDIDISNIAKENNIFFRNRPEEISKDESLMEEVVNDIISNYSDIKKYQYLLLLQPTSPLRTSSHIDNAIKLFRSQDADALISVTHTLEIPQKTMTIDNDGFLSGLIDNDMPFMSRQLLEATYKPNGAIYIVNIDAFKNNNSFLQPKTIPFFMDEDSSLDIDNLEDIEEVERIMNEKG